MKTTTENGRDAVPAVQNTNNTRYSRSKSTVHITCSSPRFSHSFSFLRSSSSGAGFTSSHDLSTPYCSAVTIMQSEVARRHQAPQDQCEVQNMPGSGSEEHPIETDPTEEAAASSSNAEGKAGVRKKALLASLHLEEGGPWGLLHLF